MRVALADALEDESPDVRLTAAEALCNVGETDAALEKIRELLTFPDAIIRREAIYVLVRIGEMARPLLPEVERAIGLCPHLDSWSDDNVAQAITLLRACLGEAVEDDSMIPYKLTRRRNRVLPRNSRSEFVGAFRYKLSIFSRVLHSP